MYHYQRSFYLYDEKLKCLDIPDTYLNIDQWIYIHVKEQRIVKSDVL
jgi:predicted protein tyrosine phosphatase